MKTIAINIGTFLLSLAMFFTVAFVIGLIITAVLFGTVGLLANGHSIWGMICLGGILMGCGWAISNA